RDVLDRHGLVRLQDAQTRAGREVGDGPGQEARQGLGSDARFPEGDVTGCADHSHRAQVCRLQGRAHAVERPHQIAAAVRRDGEAGAKTADRESVTDVKRRAHGRVSLATALIRAPRSFEPLRWAAPPASKATPSYPRTA